MKQLETNPSKVVMDPKRVPKELIRELLVEYDDIDWMHYDASGEQLKDAGLYDLLGTIEFEHYVLDGPPEQHRIMNPDTLQLETHMSYVATKYMVRGFSDEDNIFYPWMFCALLVHIKPEDLNR